jgi:hypothetical protein
LLWLCLHAWSVTTVKAANSHSGITVSFFVCCLRDGWCTQGCPSWGVGSAPRSPGWRYTGRGESTNVQMRSGCLRIMDKGGRLSTNKKRSGCQLIVTRRRGFFNNWVALQGSNRNSLLRLFNIVECMSVTKRISIT